MKFNWVKRTALSVGVLLLAACSSGGGTPSNTIKIVKSDASENQTTYVSNSSNSIMSAFTNTIDNKTVIQLCRDVDKDNDCSKVMIMTIDGISPQTYTIDSPESATTIVYHDDKPERGVANHYIGTSGTIVVTGTGQALRGSFSAVLECNSGCTGTANVTGSFNVDISQ